MITVASGELANALNSVDSIIPARVVHHSFGNILIRAEGDNIACTATNLDGWITASASAEIIEPFTACVDRRIAKVVDTLPESGESKLEFKDNALALRCGRGRYKFGCTPIEEFPETPTFDDATFQFSLSDAEVKRVFKQAAASIATEDTRHYFCGLCLDPDDGQISAVSSNGHKLIRVTIPVSVGTEARPIIPEKACKAVAEMGACSIRINDRLIEARAHGHVLISKLIDSNFPAYRQIIPAPSANRAELNRADLIASLKRIKYVGSRELKNPSVNIDWDGGDLRLSSGDDAEDIIASTTSGSASLYCSISYFIELLEAIGTERVTLDHAGGGSLFTITAPDDPDVLASVMPTRW